MIAQLAVISAYISGLNMMIICINGFKIRFYLMHCMCTNLIHMSCTNAITTKYGCSIPSSIALSSVRVPSKYFITKLSKIDKSLHIFTGDRNFNVKS